LEQNYKIAIIGLGYVGLPLALSFGKHYTTIGYDINIDTVNHLNSKFNKESSILFTNNKNDISIANIYIVTVPTPVYDNNLPDLSFLESATKLIANYLSEGDIVIYESTVYPGVTEDVCVPILEKYSNLKYNTNFYCGYSPERINPGDNSKKLEDIIKVTSGSNDKSADIIDDLYNTIVLAGTYKASSIKVAEASKVVENIQRDVNIALMNELSMMFDKMDISLLEVIESAKTKWNFLDFKPGLVGGHCIGIDPYYLIYKSKESGYNPDLINTSRGINNYVPNFIVNKTKNILLNNNKVLNTCNILILGYSFKENCEDTRNTKVKDIVSGLELLDCRVDVYDPVIKINHNNSVLNPFKLSKKYDAFIVAVAHNEFLKYTLKDFNEISKENLVLLDIKGIYNFSTWTL
jgi:UDP-N-acetyl-D-galactosamine dehydrogenase|tara:strand:+ start:112 stop:1332 length:1221 start_codon:yes stop_codon:yes gene_type:complete